MLLQQLDDLALEAVALATTGAAAGRLDAFRLQWHGVGDDPWGYDPMKKQYVKPELKPAGVLSKSTATVGQSLGED